jgi:uncharacterized protein
LKITTTLADIAAAAQEKEAENQAFRTFLQSKDTDDIDQLVRELDAIITPQIDCTTCGNCCSSLMINVTPDEVTRLAGHLNKTEAEVKEEYIETGANNSLMIINTIPCHFLKNRCCTIYEQRFTECREFPGLHQPQFTKRLFAMLAHYGRCLIIYNVMEEMKKRLEFEGC